MRRIDEDAAEMVRRQFRHADALTIFHYRLHDVLQQQARAGQPGGGYSWRKNAIRDGDLNARIEVARRNPRKLYSAAVKATDSAALQNLEEDLKQTSAARKLICRAIHAHLTNQHSQTCGVRLAA